MKQARDEVIVIRVKPEEKEALQVAASPESVSQFVRQAVREAIKRSKDGGK